MAKKYVVLFIASIFFLGLLRVGFCQSVNSKASLACCLGKSHSSDNESHHSAQEQREDCFSHCAKQKIYAIKTEGSLRETPKIKTPLFLENKFSSNPQNYLFNSPLTVNYYLNQTITKLNISQIYFIAVFNRAPPLALN